MTGPSQNNEEAVDQGMADVAIQAYRSTPVFDETSLPPALRAEHRLKAGVWGRIHVLEGRLKLTIVEPAGEIILTPGTPGRLLPEQAHFVEPLGSMKMRVDFYDAPPDG